MIFAINSPKYGIKEVQIDDEDWPMVSQYKWHLQFDPTFNQFYVVTNSQNKKKIKASVIEDMILAYVIALGA